MNINRLETPALILDKKIFDNNIEAMKNILSGSSLKLRPHFKSHKCAQIAHIQMNNGAKGMTCAKLSEAVELVDCGIDDILIANQVTDVRKIRRLADLAGDCHLTVCVDRTDNIKDLAVAAKNAGTVIHCLVEFEIGMMRCGVTSKEQVLKLAKLILSESNLEFAGIQAYAGHISHIEDLEERKQMTDENAKRIREVVDYLKANNIDVNIISGGSTGTSQIKAQEELYTELQAGSYLFMDNTYKELGLPFKNSLFVLSTVISNREGLTIVDAGLKTCGVDQGMPGILNNKAAEVVASEEHFQLHGLEKDLSVGDKVFLIPGHCCSTINLYDRIYVVEDGKVVDRILVTGRGYGK